MPSILGFAYIDLLQATVFRLNDEEEDNKDQSQTAAGEDQAVEVSDRASDESGEERHQEVPEPVACGSEGHAWSTIAGWVELSHLMEGLAMLES